MNNFTNNNNVPLGLGMAMAKNLSAMSYFASLEAQKQNEIIEKTHTINSKREMQHYVDSMFNQIS